MTPKEVVDFYGGTQVKAGEAIGVSQAAISEWFQNGYVPIGRQYEIQVLTGGRLRADPEEVKRLKSAA